METEIVKPFIDATVHTLKVQAQLEAKHERPYIKEQGFPLTGDISGVIGIMGKTFNGSVVISFPETTFLKVMSNMLGELITSLTQEIIDGAGEMTNIIFGQAKVVLNEKGHGIQMAIPSIISGKNHFLTHHGKGTIIVIPFQTEAGPFFIEIYISYK